jgi:nitrate/nitrite transport system ATP-binding protein
LMADRVIPLTAGPRATLGPSIPVTLDRPRLRAELNDSYDFKQIRAEVVDYLLMATPRTTTGTTRTLVLPDIEPENPSTRRTFGGSHRPLRRAELQQVNTP